MPGKDFAAAANDITKTKRSNAVPGSKRALDLVEQPGSEPADEFAIQDMEVDTPQTGDLFFNMNAIDGPPAHIANFLDKPADRDAFLSTNKNLRPSYLRNKAFRIPFEMPVEELRGLLPVLRAVGKIIITVNVKQLLILKECPELRNLVVEDLSAKDRSDEYSEYLSDEEEDSVEEDEVDDVDEISEDGESEESDGESYGSEEASLPVEIEYDEAEYWTLDLGDRVDPFFRLLSEFHNLTHLKLRFGVCSNELDFENPLQTLTKLISLDMSGVITLGSENVVGMKELRYLDLSGTSVMDISPLSDLHQLRHLNLSGASVDDISPLINLTRLTHLDLSYNTAHGIPDISVLSNFKNLVEFVMHRNRVGVLDMSVFASLIHLTKLDLSENPIHDPNGLASLAGLHQLTALNLAKSTEAISDLSPLRNLTKLTELNLRQTGRHAHEDVDYSILSDMSLLKPWI
jgi:hypothetical protein